MSIYKHCPISEALGIRNIHSLIEFDDSITVPEDAVTNLPKGESWDYYFPGDEHPFTGKTHSKEHKAKLSKLMKEKREANPNMGNHQPHSEEAKSKISAGAMGNTSALGKTWSNPESHKEKSRARMLVNNPMDNPESVDKIRQKALQKKKCPHCDMRMNAGCMSRHIKARHSQA
jgi:hypothetical protein